MDPRLYSSPPPPPYPYYSPPPPLPPPPPPKPPMCNDTIPPPPPKPPACNHTVPPPPPSPPPPYPYYSPPPPSPSPPPPYPYYSPPPPQQPCNYTPPQPTICECICPPPTWPPYVPTPYSIAPSPMSPDGNHHVTYIAVFVSLGGVFFLAFLAVGLFCLAKKRKKGVVMIPAEAETCVDEHQHIQETITTGPCGEQTVNLTIDNDRQIHEISEAGIVESGAHHPHHHHNNG